MINPGMLPIIGGKGSTTGMMTSDDVADLQKALTADYGVDQSALTGGSALRIQSLDKTLFSTIQDNQHFALMNALSKSTATATVDEWTEKSAIGGFPGGSTNSELGVIAQANGTYNRRVGMVKYLMTQRQISFVLAQQNSIVEAQAIENIDATLQLLTDAESLCFEGDSSINPTEYDGIYKIMDDLGSATHVLDAAGEDLCSIAMVDQAAANIFGAGNFGRASHIFMSQLTQSSFNTNLDPAFRVSLTGAGQDIMLGAPVDAIRTSWGNIKCVPDVFIRDEAQQVPFEVTYSAAAVANVALQQASYTCANTGSGGADSKWTAKAAGLYYYAVCGLSNAGQSAVVLSTQITVAQGEQVTLAITHSTANAETGYAIYRGRKGGTNAVADLRLVKRIPRAAGGGVTTWIDKNHDLPGTTKATLLTMTGGGAISWRQYLPLTKFDLYPTNSAVIPWAVLLFGYLRVTKRLQHNVIKNICPAGAVWDCYSR